MSPKPDITEFMSAVLKSTSIEEVWEMLADCMKSYGFDRMIYGSTRFRTFGDFGDVSDAIVLTNHDKNYIDLFFGQEMYVHAPMAIWAAQNIGAKSWRYVEEKRTAGELSDAENKFLQINDEMGVVAGYSISFNEVSSRSKAAIGLCAERGRCQDSVDELWEEFGEEIILLNNLAHLKITNLPPTGKKQALTDRQREVLQWVADGKTTQDIATILALNKTTIEKHLRLARENLNADTTAQAIAKASAQNQMFVLEG